MLCSVPVAAGKADSNPNPNNSNSNWLDRLRSNKGFPIAADDLGLDHFLTHHNQNPSPDSPPPLRRPPQGQDLNSNPNPDPSSSSSSYLLITGILSDLFNIAPNPTPNNNYINKKFPRKQSNPKLCPIIPPLANNAEDPHNKQQHNILSSNSDNTSKSKPKPKPKPKAKPKLQHEDVEQEADDDDDDERADKDLLVGYSKSEVTVIDTSCDLWKSDKLIFRRNNLWKVKDKKGKAKAKAKAKSSTRSHGRKMIKRNHSPTPSPSPNNKTKLLWSSHHHHHPFHFTAQQLPPNHSLNPFNRGYNPQYCAGPENSANAHDSSNDKKENACAVSPENGSYDTEKSGKFSCM